MGGRSTFRKVRNLVNALFGKDGLHAMLEGKDYQCTDTLFLFIAGYFDRVKECKKDPRQAEINALYSELGGSL